MVRNKGFKPYYKWITFNTKGGKKGGKLQVTVLNLIINGLPSILNQVNDEYDKTEGF